MHMRGVKICAKSFNFSQTCTCPQFFLFGKTQNIRQIYSQRMYYICLPLSHCTTVSGNVQAPVAVIGKLHVIWVEFDGAYSGSAIQQAAFQLENNYFTCMQRFTCVYARKVQVPSYMLTLPT